ncbi:MAG TPA: Glu/Leu/Phe/Val dehydrogenase dimerization domain-containing protein [Candidatus Dormibacteraeota bacterium]|nr:Glu/Leu/Phe/Val dehydrogenase dimerization domain-containing protein [Candidatus Dormibacteraeota bacterium]
MSQTKVSRDVTINGEKFALLVETEHQGIAVSTAVHRQQHEHRQGGVRFVRQGTREELGHLARGMTEKCAASRVPLDGLKCLAITPNGEPAGSEEKVALLAEHSRVVIQEDAGVIFGPDMGWPEEVLSEVATFPGLLDHLTGLTARVEGESSGRFLCWILRR